MENAKTILLVLVDENKTRIKNSIILLTGLKPMEKVMPDKYILKLGIMEPIIIEYKRLPDISLEKMRRLTLIEMLARVCRKMIKIQEFIAWTVDNKTFINKQN